MYLFLALLTLVFELCASSQESHTFDADIHYPPFSWDTVPIFWQGANVSGAFSQEALDTISRFPVIVIEKAQGMNGTVSGWLAEDYMLQAAQQFKAINSSLELVWYWNSVLDWIVYHMHYEFLNHSEWWLRNMSGDVMRQSGDSHVAQPPDGMLIFDLSQWECSEWWATRCLNATQSGYFDGCNADRVYQLSFNGVSNDTNELYATNKIKVLQKLQQQLNDTGAGTLWLNYGSTVEGVRGMAFEGWGNFEGAIWDMNNATHDNPNIMIKAHAGYCHDNTNCGCLGQSLINDLATFLVCAKKYAYFNCNKNWLLNDTNFGWYEEYGKPLGAPNQENGVKVDDTYYRSFATGTGVIFNATSRQGRIFWSDEWDAWLLKQLDDRITDWYENIDTNYDLVDKRRIYMPEFDILL